MTAVALAPDNGVAASVQQTEIALRTSILSSLHEGRWN
jgi:hypothetical protein